jgi:hypothetical protein
MQHFARLEEWIVSYESGQSILVTRFQLWMRGPCMARSISLPTVVNWCQSNLHHGHVSGGIVTGNCLASMEIPFTAVSVKLMGAASF